MKEDHKFVSANQTKLPAFSSMAIRVLALRRSTHRIFSVFSSIPTSPTRRIQTFPNFSNPVATVPVGFTGIHECSHHASLANLLHGYGFTQSEISEFIRKNGFLLNCSVPGIQKCIAILLSLGLSEEPLVSILSANPRVLELGFMRKWQLGFEKLEFATISPSVIRGILEQSAKFVCQPEDICRKILDVKNLGFSDATVIRVLERWPIAFGRGTLHVSDKVEFLKGIGIKSTEIDRICYSYPDFLGFGIDSRLKPLLEEFKDLEFSRNEVRKALISDPYLILSMEVGEVTHCVDLIKSLKCRNAIKERILSKGALRAAIDTKLRVDCLCRHGLIRRDAFKVLFIEPRSILYDIQDMEKKVEFFVHRLGYSIECLVNFPKFLGVNLEKQIVPRYTVVEYLRSNGVLGFDVGLKHLVMLSRLKFYNLLVKPYPECEKIFGEPKRVAEVKVRHPTGMWKLFKPPKFSDSKEDVRNMKLFMDSLI